MRKNSKFQAVKYIPLWGETLRIEPPKDSVAASADQIEAMTLKLDKMLKKVIRLTVAPVRSYFIAEIISSRLELLKNPDSDRLSHMSKLLKVAQLILSKSRQSAA